MNLHPVVAERDTDGLVRIYLECYCAVTGVSGQAKQELWDEFVEWRKLWGPDLQGAPKLLLFEMVYYLLTASTVPNFITMRLSDIPLSPRLLATADLLTNAEEGIVVREPIDTFVARLDAFTALVLLQQKVLGGVERTRNLPDSIVSDVFGTRRATAFLDWLDRYTIATSFETLNFVRHTDTDVRGTVWIGGTEDRDDAKRLISRFTSHPLIGTVRLDWTSDHLQLTWFWVRQPRTQTRCDIDIMSAPSATLVREFQDAIPCPTGGSYSSVAEFLDSVVRGMDILRGLSPNEWIRRWDRSLVLYSFEKQKTCQLLVRDLVLGLLSEADPYPHEFLHLSIPVQGDCLMLWLTLATMTVPRQVRMICIEAVRAEWNRFVAVVCHMFVSDSKFDGIERLDLSVGRFGSSLDSHEIVALFEAAMFIKQQVTAAREARTALWKESVIRAFVQQSTLPRQMQHPMQMKHVSSRVFAYGAAARPIHVQFSS